MARYAHGTAVLAIRAVAVILAIALVTSVATGWLYWLRAGVAHWPGPRVADALPLDELPGHDSVPLLVYAVAFGLAGAALGLIARAVRLDRLTAGVGLAAGTGAWLLLLDAFCLLVVRQLPAGHALRAAARLQPVYVAAALAGAGGALLGRNKHPGGMTPRLLAWLVAAGGLINLISAVAPRPGRLGMLEPLAPGVVKPAAHVLLVPVGLLLLITSRGLLRQSRRAWRLAAGLLGTSVVLHLFRGPDYSAAVALGLMAVALLACRADFPFRGDPAARPSALLRLGGMLLLAVVYGVTTVWAYRTASDLPVSFPLALLDTLRAMGGQLPHDVQYLPPHFADWFAPSVLSAVAIGVIWASAVWLRPWRQAVLHDTRRWQEARRIVRQWGTDTLAPFTLRGDKEWFVHGQTLIAYRVIRGIALVSGDPVGPEPDAGGALQGFLAYARARGWRTAVLGASDRLLQAYRELGLHPVYHGDEAVIDTARFSLDGRRMRTVRQAVHRLQRNGYRAEVVMAGSVLPALRAELAAVEQTWLAGEARKGFTMELDTLFRLGGTGAAFVIGRDAQGQVAGFLHLTVCTPSRCLSLSSMPRLRGTPNGFNAWLIAEAVSWARCHGFGRLSLNFSPFAGLLATHAELPSGKRLQRLALLRLKGILALQMDNLLQFNGQFDPGRMPRYVILQAWADLPRVTVAAMAAEGYLPHANLIRGRDWTPAPAGTPAVPGEKPAVPGETPAVPDRTVPSHRPTPPRWRTLLSFTHPNPR